MRLERLDAATIRNQEYRSPAGAGGPRFIGFNFRSAQLRASSGRDGTDQKLQVQGDACRRHVCCR
jgi:hypothetical protein